MTPLASAKIIADLQSDILRLQGFNPSNSSQLDLGLSAIKNAFPNGCFPLGAVHEFLSFKTEDKASTNGFIAALLSTLMGTTGVSLWISSSRTLFPPALKYFGLEPDRFIFIDLKKENDVLWVMDEALKCGALTSVVGEVREINFMSSRRLQLAVEKSRVTGFLLRTNVKKMDPTACVSRWKITSLPSESFEDLPGIGFPKWKVELLRIRNGRPGAWDFQWINGKFQVRQREETSNNLIVSKNGYMRPYPKQA